MKKKSASQSGFFNLRVLIGVFMVLAGVFLAFLGSGAFSATAASIIQAMQKGKIITSSTDPLVPVGFDCSTIHEKGIDKQENFRAGAIMIACGQVPGASTSATSTLGLVGRFFQKLLTPLAYGATDVDLVTGAETSPNVTQSETYTLANPDNPLQIVTAYNDSRGRNASPINISGASVSTDGGTTFTRLTLGSGQGPFSNTLGDPVVLYNRPTGTWFTVWLDGGCGGQGIGGYKSTTPENPASWTHFTCVYSEGSADRESGWSDNNPSSPYYGRMYVSWNDFAVGSGALVVSYSSDNGATWHAPITVSNLSTFIRDVQITGDLSGNGVVYIAGMDDGGGGFPHNNINHLYKSTDGGASWTNTYTSPTSFPGPGVTANGYFACMFSDGAGYWRHEGWGEPAAYNNV
ncbi:MAG: sialidase family protein, partial [Candidatus Udaeobacter sp.]